MAQAEANRRSTVNQMNYVMSGARMVGHDGEGHVAIWFGGYTVNIYDAAGDWSEVNAVTSGTLAGMTDMESAEAREAAAERMESEGFAPVR